MAKLETNRRKIVARLEAESWINRGGGLHDVFTKPDAKYPIVVPRHRELTPGVARNIAKAAGWT